MTAYVHYEGLFPGSQETRHLQVLSDPVLPTDKYVLEERYCADPACDCRRARLEVVSARTRRLLAIVCYAFDDDPAETPDGQNPYLEPMASQGRHALGLRDLVAHVIENDEAYRKRLERHYHDVKRFVTDHPDHDLHRAVSADRRVMTAFATGIVEGLGPATTPSRLRDHAKKRRERKQPRQSRKRNRR
jgi:hypothetical protein